MPDICLWATCDHKCVMCSNPKNFAQTTQDYSYEKIKKRLKEFKKWNKNLFWRFGDIENEWYITWWEPTLNPDYLNILHLLRKEFPWCKIVEATHGDNFADEEFAKKILEIDNYHLCLPIHGYSAETHDAITQKKGSFKKLIQWIYNIQKYRKNSQSLEVRIIIQKMNYKHLDKIYNLVWKYFGNVDKISTIMMEYEWQAVDNISKTQVTYNKVMEINEKVFLRWGEKFWERFKLFHFPLCSVKEKKLWKTIWHTLPQQEIVYMLKCKDCVLRKYCMGIHASYGEHNWFNEFIPFNKKYIMSIEIIEDENNHRFHPILAVNTKK